MPADDVLDAATSEDWDRISSDLVADAKDSLGAR